MSAVISRRESLESAALASALPAFVLPSFVEAPARMPAAVPAPSAEGAKLNALMDTNIKNFHDAGLNCGRIPLDTLDTVIDRYIAATRAA